MSQEGGGLRNTFSQGLCVYQVDGRFLAISHEKWGMLVKSVARGLKGRGVTKESKLTVLLPTAPSPLGCLFVDAATHLKATSFFGGCWPHHFEANVALLKKSGVTKVIATPDIACLLGRVYKNKGPQILEVPVRSFESKIKSTLNGRGSLSF